MLIWLSAVTVLIAGAAALCLLDYRRERRSLPPEERCAADAADNLDNQLW